MADVTQPSDALYQRVKNLNTRRDQDWARFGASIVPAVAAGLNGGPQAAAATARGFYPSYERGPSAIDVAAAKKDVIDAMVKANDAVRDDRMGLVSKLEGIDDSMDKLIPAWASIIGSANTANVAATGDVIRQRTDLIKDANAQLASVADKAATDPASVDRAWRDLTQFLTPEGVQSPAFGEVFRRYMSPAGGLSPGDQKSLLARLEIETNLRDAQAPPDQRLQGMNGILGLLAGGAAAGDPAMQQSLALAGQVMSEVSDIENATIQMRLGKIDSELQNQLRSGGMSAEKSAEYLKTFMDTIGATDPDQQKKNLEKVEQLLNMADPSKGANPDAARYADLLDSLDSDNPAPNLAEARRRLLEDPEFQAWMKQNGFQDPGLALKELRRMMRQRVQSGKMHDLELTRQRRLGEVGPDAGVPMSAKVVEDGSEQAKPVEGGVAFVMDDAGDIWNWDGSSFAMADEDALGKLGEMLESGQFDKDKLILGPEHMQEYRRMAEKPAAFEVPKTDLPKTRGPTIPMLQQQARYAVAHPMESLGNLERTIRNRLLAKKQKKEEDQAVVNATLHPGATP